MKPLAALHGIDLPRKLVGLLSWIGVMLAIFVAAAPWLIDRLVQSRMQETLYAHGEIFAQALQSHLDRTEQDFVRQALSINSERNFDQLASVWLAENPEVLQVSAYSSNGTLIRRRLQNRAMELVEAGSDAASVLPLQLLALQRAEETRRPARSALYRMGNLPVSDLFLPVNKGPYAAIAVTLDTGRWQDAVAEAVLPENIGMEVIAFTTVSNPLTGHLVNDSSWEGLWTVRLRSQDATLSALQSLQAFFVVLAAMFCILVYFSLRNLRERVQAEEALEKKLAQLDEQERLSMLGELSASIAHEINQPLAAIANYSATARLLMRSGKGAQEIEPVLSRIEEQSQRAARVMRSVRALVRKDPIQDKPVELDRLLSELKPHLELLTQGHDIGLSTKCARDLRVRADPTLLEQVFLNLVRNSVQALMRKDQGPKRIAIEGFARDHQVCLEVRDNGPGVAAEAVAHIFDSFFTTRSEGLGVGLNFCRSVLERFGARIELASSGPEGACFLITFPAITLDPP